MPRCSEGWGARLWLIYESSGGYIGLVTGAATAQEQSYHPYTALCAGMVVI